MYHGEGSRQVKGLPGLAALSGVEMELDNLAGRACDSQSRGIKPHSFPKGPDKGDGIEPPTLSSNGQRLPLVASKCCFRGALS
jgi:hypothetical protein